MAEPEVVPQDSWTKFRVWMGREKKLMDRRSWWAAACREDVPFESMSKGEQKARRRFCEAIHNGALPADAVFVALCLGVGPIPELETRQQFSARWNRPALEKLGDRWAKSPHRPEWQLTKIRKAKLKLIDKLSTISDKLIKIIEDPESPQSA